MCEERRRRSACIESKYPDDTCACAGWYIITKTRLYTFDPLKPYFYIIKKGFTRVCIIYLILLNNINCVFSLEPPRRGGSNGFPQFMFWAGIWKISDFFLIWKFSFMVVKFSIHMYLNRRVFVMFRGPNGMSHNSIKCTWSYVHKGPVVQSVVSLTSSLRVISLSVLADLIHNILICFAEKCE